MYVAGTGTGSGCSPRTHSAHGVGMCWVCVTVLLQKLKKEKSENCCRRRWHAKDTAKLLVVTAAAADSRLARDSSTYCAENQYKKIYFNLLLHTGRMGLDYDGPRGGALKLSQEDALFSVLVGSLRASREVSRLSQRFGPPTQPLCILPSWVGVRKRVCGAVSCAIRSRCETTGRKDDKSFHRAHMWKRTTFVCLPLYTCRNDEWWRWGCCMYERGAGWLACA